MFQKLAFILSAILFFMYGTCEGLECYHCYNGAKYEGRDSRFVPCNELQLNESNTWICPNKNAQCIFANIEIESTKSQQTWRTCSNGLSDPCDPNSFPVGVKMQKCLACTTDRCNLFEKENEKNTFTFNINANINLFIRQ